MPLSDNVATPDPATPKPPRCAMCRARMTIAGTQTAKGVATVTYACPKCEYTKTKIAGDPLNGGRRRPSGKKTAQPG